jgi:type 2 lantibiotic biosynthesis protein LanM
LWFISASLSSLTLGLGGGHAGYTLVPREGRAERAQFLDAARAIADRLEAMALRDEASVNWIGLTLVGERNWTLLPLVDNLYDGTLGVALFLAYAGDILGEGRYTALAKTALNNARLRFEKLKDEIESDGDKDAFKGLSVGGYGGLGSLLYVLAHAGSLWEDPALLSAAESYVEVLPRFVERDETLDVINGSAGCILNLLALYGVTASGRALEVAKACGERILSRAEEVGGGVAWSSPPEGQAPLAGFSHGAAGIACALLKLAEATGESRYAEVAFRAFEYERGLFSPEEGNWPDLRVDALTAEGTPSYMAAWCHGAPGIGLSRIQALPHEAAGPLVDEIRAAVAATLRASFDVNHSLCHGALGNAEFLYEAGRALNDSELTERAELMAASLLDSVVSGGPVCGTPDGTETPGLLTGLAGIGYGLLRAAEPGRVPSVLVLAPPAVAAASEA